MSFVLHSNSHYDPYLLNERKIGASPDAKPVSVNDLSFVVWANDVRIDQYKIKDISDEIEQLMKSKLRQVSSLLKLAGYYVANAIKVTLVAGYIFQNWNLDFDALNKTILVAVCGSYYLFDFLSIKLLEAYQKDVEVAKDQVRQEAKKKWDGEIQTLNEWMSEVPTRKQDRDQIEERATQLLQSGSELQKCQVNASLMEIAAVALAVSQKITFFNNLPQYSKDILLTQDINN